MQHKYFYTDANGNLKKYSYCSKCMAGPFTEEDLNIKFHIVESLRFCNDCGKIMKMNWPTLTANQVQEVPKEDLEKIEVQNEISEILESSEIEFSLPQFQPKQESKPVPVKKQPSKEPTKTTSSSWVVYTIKCKDDTVYHGITQNLNNALIYINKCSGPKNLRSKDKVPVTLVGHQEVSSKEAAETIKKKLNSGNFSL